MFEFLEPVTHNEITGDSALKEGQYGKLIDIYTAEHPDPGTFAWQDADIVIVGVNEERGKGIVALNHHTNAIRRQLYRLHCWHNNIKIADLGDVRRGETLQDTYSALTAVLDECYQQDKVVIVLGGSHDLTLAQYEVFAKNKRAIEVSCIDAAIDLGLESPFRNENFLMQVLTGEPNYTRHYNHIGFQSYFVHPRMMETLEKLRFDCYRLGRVRDQLGEMEPVLRNTALLSMDVSALQPACMPCNHTSPNGFSGEEACALMRYAGMSNQMRSVGIYNYNAFEDVNELGALQIAQMIWYFIDGYRQLKEETSLADREDFNEYNVSLAGNNTLFLQHKKTHRWWMQLPGERMIACSHRDYQLASHNEIPERWLRAMERD
jgi:formiminoglutamase